jgi:ankyrin repeat protein
MVELLLAYGAVPNVACAKGKTPLNYAEMHSFKEAAVLLSVASAKTPPPRQRLVPMAD